MFEAARTRSQAKREAMDAVRARAAGKTRAEVRDIVVSERRSRGLSDVPEAVLDQWVDAAFEDPTRSELRATVDAVTALVRGGVRFAELLRNGSVERQGPAEAPTPDDARRVLAGVDWSETKVVDVDADAGEFVDSHVDRAMFSFRGAAAAHVRLVPKGAGADERFEIHLDGRRIGELAPDESRALVQEGADGAAGLKATAAPAYLSRRGDGQPTRVEVGRFNREPDPETAMAAPTLWDRVSGYKSFFFDHCLVCGRPCNPHSQRRALVAKSERGSFKMWLSAPVHRSCWAAGAARARREGAGWKDSEWVPHNK
jgi:hypothetical protein